MVKTVLSARITSYNVCYTKLLRLDALTRYGWLVCSLAGQSVESMPSGEDLPGTVLATGMAVAAGVVGGVPAVEGFSEVSAAIDEAVSERSTVDSAPQTTPLPPPPERPEPKFSLRRALLFFAVTAGGVLLAVAGKSELLGHVFAPIARSGLLPGAAAVALAWS